MIVRRPALVLALALTASGRAHAGPGDAGKKAPPPAPAASDKPEDLAKPMTLADVIQVAVRQAPDLARAAIDTRAFAAIAKRALGAEDTKLTATAAIDADTFGNDTRTAQVELARLLPGGTVVAVKGDVTRTVIPGIDGAVPPVPDSKAIVADARLAITQPLLRGFGLVAANPDKYASRANRSASQLREIQAAEVMISRVVAQYWQLALSWRQLAVRRSAVDLAKKQLQYTEGAIRAGKIAGAEAIAVKQAIAFREQDVLDGEIDVWQQSMTLRVLVGMEIGPDVTPIATDELPDAEAVELDQHALIQQALDNNYDIKASTVGLGAFKASVSGARSQLLPRLDLHGEIGPVGASGDKVGTAFSNLTKADDYGYFASLDFEWNIDADGPEGEAAVQTQNLRGAEVDLTELELRVAGDTAVLIKRVEANAQAVTLGKEAIELAEANVDAEQKKMEAGKSNNNEVLRRQDELQLARLRLAVSQAQYQTARAQLEVETGTILDTHGITYRTAK